MRILIVLSAAILAAAAPDGPPPETLEGAPERAVLSRIHVEGLQRISRAEVLEASRLVPGETIEIGAIKDASARLVATGLFLRVANRYFLQTDTVEVTFDVVEAPADVQVHFDNFVWFRDGELVETVARAMPWFAGKAPGTAGVADRIAALLQRKLADHGIQGRVEYMMHMGRGQALERHMFQVKGAPLGILSFAVTGSSALPGARIRELTAPLIGESYSRSYVEKFVDATLRPEFWRAGHMAVSFEPPQAVPRPGGVVATLVVKEGPARLDWTGARWEGVSSIDPADLEKLLGQRAGQPCDGSALLDGMEAVREAYRSRGHIDAHAWLQVEVTGTPPTLAAMIRVDEGIAYKAGTLTFIGFTPIEMTRLRAKWPFRAGDPFVMERLDSFTKTVGEELARRGPGSHRVESKVRRDEAGGRVHVEIRLVS